MRPFGSPQELERRRRRAIKLLESGLQTGEVALRIGVDRRTVRGWNARYRKQGEDGIKARTSSGRPLKLDARKRKKLMSILMKGPAAAGYDSDLWTCARVQEVIWSEFGVSYHPAHIGRMLKVLGWTSQKPARRALERDEAGIERWKKEEWPRVKKTSRAGKRRSSS